MPKVLEIDVAKNTQNEREMTDAEYAQYQIDAADAAARQQAAADAAAARASALAKLAGLGLTPDEIAALVGA
jgi:hypothetical protein